MRKLAYVVGGVAAGGVAALLTLRGAPPYAQQKSTVADSIAAPILSASDSGSLKGPRQPIFFRHDIHAGQYKMQCQYCHYSAHVSPEPGIPTVQTCMGCHLVIGGSDSSHQTEIKKLRQAWNEKKPIEWVPMPAPLATAMCNECPRCSRSTRSTRWGSVFHATSSGKFRGIARYVTTRRQSPVASRVLRILPQWARRNS
jgi:hypothetical protein